MEMMDSVYVLFEGSGNDEYCGETLIGIYSSLEKAERGAVEYCNQEKIEFVGFKPCCLDHWDMQIDTHSYTYYELSIKKLPIQ
jgi:hypothetical protein